MDEKQNSALVFIVGPTAVGKSNLALKWAQKEKTCIVNCDSIQVYKSLNIGTSKPSTQDLKKVPHYLFNVFNEGELATAGKYRNLALDLLEKMKAYKKPLLFVGGSGFYIQALEKGMFPVKPSPLDKVKKWEKIILDKGLLFAYKELEKKDPEYSKKISPKDSYRIQRALIILETEKKTLTQIQKEFEMKPSSLPRNVIKIGLHLSTDELRKRVTVRTEEMLTKGFVEEVRELLAKGLKDWRPLKSVGYAEVVEHINGGLSQLELSEKIIQSTMSLARRQRTWFQRDKSINWFEGTLEGIRRAEIFLTSKT